MIAVVFKGFVNGNCKLRLFLEVYCGKYFFGDAG